MLELRPLKLCLCIVMLLCFVGASFTLYPRPVHGVVEDALNAQPVAHASLEVGGRSISSSEMGRYDLGWLQGDPPVTARADGYLHMEVVAPRNVLPGLRVVWTISLTPNSLAVHVLDAESNSPLGGSIIAVDDWSSIADPQGQITLRRIRSGALLSASLPGYETATAVFEGQRTQEFALEPVEVHVHVRDLYSGEPLASASLSCDALRFTTDESGVVVIKRLVKGMPLTVQAAGHDLTHLAWDGSDDVEIAIRPNVLRGSIMDQESGGPLTGAIVSVISRGQVVSHSITDPTGRYSCITPPGPATLVVAAPGYERVRWEIGATAEKDISLAPFQARAVYMPFGMLTDEGRMRSLVDLVERTELNAIVVDIKNDRGWLAYPSDVAEARRSDAYRSEVTQLIEFLSLCQERGIYTIARLVLFKDPTLAAAYPEWAVHARSGDPWQDLSGIVWTDPFVKEVQDYNVTIAREVAMMGFDELQFDYLRFPSDGDVENARYAQESTLDSRCATIRSFVARLRRELQPYAVLTAADLFGMTAWVTPENDLGIGQRVLDVAPFFDYLCPMLYPSTFGSGSIDIPDPLLHPYEIVYRSCLELTRYTTTRVRPWLQHYSWGDATYGVTELRQEKQAAVDAAVDGWMFWNSAGVYQQQAFDLAGRVGL